MISIVIPAYNEQLSIGNVIEKLKKHLSDNKIDGYEIMVVDDGSTDKTGDVARELDVTVISQFNNLGYGISIKNGIKKARHDTILIMDGDGTYPVDRIADMLAEYKKGYDMVVGARQGKYTNPGLVKPILRWGLKLIIEFTTGRRIPDINSGFRIFSKKTISKYLPNLSNAFSFTTSLTLAYLLTYKFASFVPVEYSRRVTDTKVKVGWDTLRTMQYIVEVILFFNPIKIFLVLMGGTLILSFLFLMVPLLNYNPWVSISLNWPFFINTSLIFFIAAIFLLAMGFLSIQLKHILQAYWNKTPAKD